MENKLEQLKQWATQISPELERLMENIELLHQKPTVLIELFKIVPDSVVPLINVDGENLNSIRTEVFNLAKILKTSEKIKGINIGDIVSLKENLMAAVPNPEKGYTTEGIPKAGFVPFGALLPFFFHKQKFGTEKQNELLFLIPFDFIDYKIINIEKNV